MQFGEQKLTGGAAIVEAARANGMTTIFGVPGVQIYPLFDALHGTDVELIVPRHEQAAAYMAMGYAKSTGRTGVFTVVPGPGVLNAAAALCTAMGNCAPVVCLTGQVPSSFLGPRARPSARARRPARHVAHARSRTLGESIRPATHRGSSTEHFATRPAAAPARSPSRCAGTRWRAQAPAVIEPAEGRAPGAGRRFARPSTPPCGCSRRPRSP